MTISGLKWLEPDVQPSIYKRLIELDDDSKAWLLENGCLNHQTSILWSSQVGFGSSQVLFCYACLSVSYRWISLSMKFSSLRINPKKDDVFPRTRTLPASRAKPPPHRFFSRCDSYVPFSRVTIHALLVPPPFPPDFSFTTEKPHERGGIRHWLDNRPHSAGSKSIGGWRQFSMFDATWCICM